jgi:deoxyribodipyrimidine photo-lyase
MTRSERPAIVWFRRDLRVHDHPALTAGAAHPRSVPLFVVDPVLLAGRFASPNRTWFLLRSLASLRTDLRARGSDLVVRVGDPREIVPAVALAAGAGDVYVSRDHAPYGRRRDAAVAAALDARGLAWHPRPANLVHEPETVITAAGGPFRVFSPFRRAWARPAPRPVLPAPDWIPPLPPGLDPGDLPPAAVPPTADPASLPEPGEAAARRRLDAWLDDRIDGYARSRDRLDDEAGTSRLSAALHLGLLSATEVLQRVHADASEGRRVFTNELVWREFYAHLLFHDPAVRTRAVRPEYERIAWADDPDGLAAWQGGRTGYPVVDAAMRQLSATGWMPNRARMITASFLTKDLLIDWRLGEAHFMRHLVDGDVASNNGGWQWSASTGSDAQPYFRVFNPVLQGRRFDPDGGYVRRWLPELAGFRADRIHAPWEATTDEQVAAGCRVGIDYPAPIVDHSAARVRAIATYEAVRRTS